MTEQSFAQATGGLRFLETMQNFLLLFAAIGFTSAVHVVAPGAVVVQPYTNYPGSTAPLVHAPVVHTPVVAVYAAHPWTGLVHVLKKRDRYDDSESGEHPYDNYGYSMHETNRVSGGHIAGNAPWYTY